VGDVVADKETERDGYKVGAAFVSQEKPHQVTPEQRGRFKTAFWKCFAMLAKVSTHQNVDHLMVATALRSHFGEENGSGIAYAIERAFVERDELREKVKKLEEQVDDWRESAMDRNLSSSR